MTGASAVVDHIPRDEGLPQLQRLLNAGVMGTVLERTLPPGATISNVRILYLRYKPSKRLIVRYAVTLDDRAHDVTAFADPGTDLAGWTRDPHNLALARKVESRAPASRSLVYDTDVGALIQWLPLDLTLPALAEEPAELRRLLNAAGVEMGSTIDDEPTLLAYKARRRAVLQLDGHVVKLYAGASDFANAVVGLETSTRANLVVPTREAVLPALQLTCQTLLDGKPPVGHHAAAKAAGAALANFHEPPGERLRRFSPAEQFAAAAASARSAAAVVPDVGPRLEALLHEIELRIPDDYELVAAHGDFHANQVLELDPSLAVIDFDETCAAPAALDFSSYVAHLTTGAAGELEAALVALDDLVSGYGARPAHLAWYVATSIIRRAPFPFRFMENGWASRVEQMIADAEEALCT